MTNVKDDLMNAWGCFLLPENETITSISPHAKTESTLESLSEEFNKAWTAFKFITATASGSKAVQWVLSNQEDINSVLIGSGCYVSGDEFHIISKMSTAIITKENFGELGVTWFMFFLLICKNIS